MKECHYCGHGLPKKKNYGYHKRIKTLRRWVYSKSLTRYEKLLVELGILIQNLLPQEQVKSIDEELFKQILEKIEDEKLKTIYELLVYGITLLHQTDRVYENNHWMAAKEDLMTALYLVQPKMIPSSMMAQSTRRFYQVLLENFYPHDFTISQAYKTARISRAGAHKHLMAMENAGYVERTGGDRNKGYTYNVGYWPWTRNKGM